LGETLGTAKVADKLQFCHPERLRVRRETIYIGPRPDLLVTPRQHVAYILCRVAQHT
jgi:hypothetical protein